MTTRTLGMASLVLALAAVPVQGQLVPPGDKEPVLRLEAGGPTSFVTSLTFSPDGKRLYASGYDKVVRVWTLNGQNDRFELDRAAYRVPIGPGIDGTINALALSPDEKWLAVAGQGIVRGGAGFRMPGLILPKIGGFTDAMWRDMGLIYVFNTKTREVRVLPGHRGPVLSLAFAPSRDGKPDLLVSAGHDFDDKSSKFSGALRLWDVDKGELLEKVAGLPVDNSRPGLDAWHTGGQLKQVRVAVSWGDGNFRLWDVDRDTNPVATVEEPGSFKNKDGTTDKPLNNNIAVYLADRDKVLTGSLGTPGGQLRMWNVPRGQEPIADPRPWLAYPSADGTHYIPRSLALFSSKGDSKQPDHAALVLRVLSKGSSDAYQLHLLDLASGEIKVKKTLWEGQSRMPVVVAASSSRHLAMAGNSDHEIYVMPIQNLLKGGNQLQLLRSAGKPMHFAAFVRKGEDRGVLLSRKASPIRGKQPRAPQEEDVVFDFNRRAFTTELEGWKIDAPDASAWKVTQVRDDKGNFKQPFAIDLVKGDVKKRVRKLIDLDEKDAVTDFALLPSMPPWNVPLLAVAYHDNGNPFLNLYNVDTGEQVRRYTGHSERIHSLAFSADGMFLVSAADDQTVCVWSTAKLAKYLGKVGMVPGVAVKNVIVASQVDKKLPALKGLDEWDVVLGLLEDGKLKPFNSRRGLYEAAARYQPGKTVTLKVHDPQDKEKAPVSLVIGAQIDERRQGLLLSLGLQDPFALASLVYSADQLSPLPGLSLRYAPVVAQVKDDAPAQKDLKKGDVIEGMLDKDGKLQPLQSARAYYEAMALAKPGAQVALQIRGKGNVAVAVGQGSDERKPLFSVFVSGGAKPAQWEWVGWSPIGPYEASDAKAERLIGWHFNTGDPAVPASFALADQYRKEYYREGILKLLIARGDLAPALKEWEDNFKKQKPTQPKMTMWIDEVGPDPAKLDGQGRVLARQSPAKLKLAIDDLAPDRIDSITWQLDGGEPRKFPRGSSAREQTALLDLLRGVHKVRVVIRTYEAQPEEFSRELIVRYLPPAPVVQPGAAQRQIVNNPAFAFKAAVQPGPADVAVNLSQKVKDKEIQARQWPLSKKDQKPLALSQDLKLEEGDNVIEVVAVNQDAKDVPAEERELETARRTWVITYVSEVKAAPPQISLNQLVPLSPAGEEGQPLTIEPAKTLIVNEPKVRIAGTIQAAGGLAQAEWRKNKDAGQKLAVRNKGEIRQELALEPGVQSFAFLARAAKSEAAEVELKIDYRPQLPRLSLTSPPQGLILYDEGKGAPPIKVEGLLSLRNNQPFAPPMILLNDKPVAVKVDVQKSAFSAALPDIGPGDNRIQVRLENQWGMVWTSPALSVRYVRPPHHITFEPVSPMDKPLIDLSARVQSPSRLIRESVEALVNDQELTSDVAIEPAADKPNQYVVRLTKVPLEPNKESTIRLWVSNTEARCQLPGELKLKFVPQPKAAERAEVEIIEPAKDVNVRDPDLPVRFRVKSAAPLQRVELVREGRSPQRIAFDLTGIKPNAQGVYEFQKVVGLLPQVNRLRVTALNDGGEQSAALVANYLYAPVRLTIDRLEMAGTKPIAPQVLPDGRLSFTERLPQGRVALQGRVTWSKEDDEQLKKISLVRVYVNGFQQIPAELRPPTGDSRERQFRADLLLNRFEDNQVEIELPDLKQDSGNRDKFALACAKPEPGQRLHLLVVGVGEKDEKKLEDQALQALRANKDKGQLKTPAFSQVRIYGPLTDFVSPEQVFTQLCLIKKTIDVLAAEQSPNDVVMMYYQGNEAVKTEGNFYETSLSKYDKELKRSGITLRGLNGFFDETLGAKLLMLDVARAVEEQKPTNDELVKMSPNTFFSVVRYVLPGQPVVSAGGSALLSDWDKAATQQKDGMLQGVTNQLSNIKETKRTLDRFVTPGAEKIKVD